MTKFDRTGFLLARKFEGLTDEELFRLDREERLSTYPPTPEELARHNATYVELDAAQREFYNLVLERRINRMPEGRTPHHTCKICGAPTDMVASLGPACPDHYDDLSG